MGQPLSLDWGSSSGSELTVGFNTGRAGPASWPASTVPAATPAGAWSPTTEPRTSDAVDPRRAAEPSVLLLLDLAGTFAFALNGALTAVRAASLDVVGVVTLGLITAVGGGIIRDVLLGDLPPATFVDRRYLAVATAGG